MTLTDEEIKQLATKASNIVSESVERGFGEHEIRLRVGIIGWVFHELCEARKAEKSGK